MDGQGPAGTSGAGPAERPVSAVSEVQRLVEGADARALVLLVGLVTGMGLVGAAATLEEGGRGRARGSARAGGGADRRG